MSGEDPPAEDIRRFIMTHHASKGYDANTS